MTPVDDRPTELLRGIRHSNPAVRIRAARGLAKLATPLRQAFPILLAAVNDPEQGVREAAIQALGTYGQEVLPTLMELLNHPDKYVRRNAVWAIGKFGPAVPALIEAMRGTNVVLCRLASKALSQIGVPALEALMANLRHSDPFVRAEAALAVGWMGPPAAEALSDLVQLVEAYRPKVRYRPPAPMHAGQSGTVTPPAPPSTAPQSSEETARLNGIQALGRIGDGAALGLLNEIANSEEEPYRAAANLAIRQIESAAD